MIRDRIARAREKARTSPGSTGFDIAVAIVVGGGSLAQTVADHTGRHHHFPVPLAVTAPTALLLGVLMWWRRRRPALVTLLGCAAVFVCGAALAALVGLTALAIRRRDRVLAAAVAVVYVSLVAVPVLYTHTGLWSELFGDAFVVGLFVVFGAYVGARRDLVASLRDRADRAEAERELRAEQARLGERARIAQEMHDVLAHKVSLIALHAGGLELNPQAGPDQVERSAVLIRSTARQALEDLRDVLGVLRTDESSDGAQLAPQPKLSDVRRLVEASRSAGVVVDLVATGDAEALCSAESDSAATLPEQLGRTAYRVVQEGLTNVHKHARGASAVVRIDGVRGRQLAISVTNLRPVSAGSLLPGAGAGLVGLRERVELAGGTLRSGRSDDGGWLLMAALPWPAGSESDGSESDGTEPAGPAVATESVPSP